MTVFLSPVGGAGAQFFDNNGVPLSGGKLYTYAAGTTTNQTTYTSSAGVTAHTNPIILDSAGRVSNSGEIWLTDSISYKFALKNSTDVLIGTYDDVIGINSGVATDILSTLAAPSGSSLIGFQQPSTTARTVQSKLRDTVSVLDFGADSTGVQDSTSAFNTAIATGKRVFVPAGVYSVADITVVSSLCVEGESPLNSSSILEVRTNNSGAFTHSSTGFLSDITISNLTIRAASGVTGARAYKQIDKSTYSAYVIFRGLETWRNLQIAFDGFFIFTRWENCRDGYYGSAVVGQTHQAINSNPATYGQGNQTNLNQITNCQFFGSSHPNGAIDISYGDRWDIRGTDFEQCSTRAIYALGVFGIHITGCWFELCDSTSVIYVSDSPSPNPQAVRLLEVDNCFCLPAAGTVSFVDGFGAGFGSYRNIGFIQVPISMVFTSATEVNQLVNIRVLSGLSTTFTTNTQQVYAGIVRNSTLENTVISSPSMQNINVLPIGPSGLDVVNLSDNYLGTVDPNPTNISSGLGLSTTAVQYTLGDQYQWVWYSFNAKMVAFLQGKTITVVINGYGVNALVADGVRACVWDSVIPGAGNQNAVAVPQINVAATGLQTSYVTYTVGASATSLSVGWFNGGSNPLKTMVIETMAVYLGTCAPILGNLK